MCKARRRRCPKVANMAPDRGILEFIVRIIRYLNKTVCGGLILLQSGAGECGISHKRDDTPPGFRALGRQSYFEDQGYRRFDYSGHEVETDQADSVVKRAGTINGIATDRQTIVIGGFKRKEMVAAPYTAGGPITIPAGESDLHRDGPDAVAVSEDSTVHSGILAAGSRSGSVVAMGGTSATAPQISRWIGEQLAGNPHGADQDAVKQKATDEELAYETANPPVPARPPRERGGCGRIKQDPVVTLLRYVND